ncbi:tetratricopeptide repeat protein [Colwellia sp. Arc7-D]|uniref:tetratricopeptide repeat protein n=1 Tax=Colwellia sp. Arc7-D TaxID=2161872 RepID=UPI0013A56B5E|nr:tetratricopeptide repeat protein [Colwellia sp. Arc7-D]
MSVINQMLKDLDKRQSEQQDNANVSVPVTVKNSTTKIILITVAVIVIINIIGMFGWQLYSENTQLKLQAQQKKAFTVQPNTTIAKSNVDTNVNKEPVLKPSNQTKTTESVVERNHSIQVIPDTIATEISDKSNTFVTKSSSEVANVKNSNNSNYLEAKILEKDDTVVIVAPLETIKKAVQPESLSVSMPVKVKSSLTISRTQLSPKALAANKISQAEKAMERNDIAKAESLFEEILMVMPTHETARKQLAALWYGKKYYQDAINLLSQGIALEPQAEEMRLMSARIYYEQGQARPAYNILKPVSRSNSSEVQTLLANVSAELNEHEDAIFAYRQLISLQPDVGRWWLGVAVSLDSLGKFVPARDAYKQSIARNNLSTSAMQFAQQRLIELGE